MYALWTGFNGGGTNIILLTCDRGGTWTDPVTVNDDNTDPAHQVDNFFRQGCALPAEHDELMS